MSFAPGRPPSGLPGVAAKKTDAPRRGSAFAAIRLALLSSLLSLPSPSPAVAAPPALHAVYLSHDLRTATLVTAAPSPDAPDSFIVLSRRDSVPVDVSWLYDGVRFDPFPRNPRTDPAFGMGGSDAVSTVLALDLPAPTPPGPVRFFTGEPDGPVFCIGTAPDLPAPGEPFVLPSASGLSAHRDRTAFALSPDRSSAVESFEITLRNDTASTVPVTVVEHLLRSPDWEIVASSVRQTPDRPASLIRMETSLPPRSSKTVSYTVRYQIGLLPSAP